MIKDHINEIIKACIHCGMCLPACPTYQVTGNEANSPRGRIYIVNDLIQNPEHINETTNTKYLDDCLNCLACETVCPSNVDYHSILDYARVDLGKSNYDKGFGGLIRNFAFKFLLPNRKRLKLLRDLYGFAAKIFPLQKINKLSPKFDKAYKVIETDHVYMSSRGVQRSEAKVDDVVISHSQQEIATPPSEARNDASPSALSVEPPIISLPLGCVMDTMYNDVHWDTIKVLNAFGYDVYIPPTNCCGALAYHSHEEKLGKEQFTETEKILEEKGYPVISNSAGCGAFMKAQNSKLKVMDLIEALQAAPENPLQPKRSGLRALGSGELPSALSPQPRALYHPACHLNHVQHLAYDYLDILKQIPGLEFDELYEADICCGSAGFYNLIKPEMADAIGKRKAENIKNTQAKLVITANPGCMSQIQAQLGDNFQVQHPVTVLAKYLKSI